MEIVFKSSTQPERLFLHDVLAKNSSDAVCDTISTTSLLPKKSHLSSFEALANQESLFRLALTNIKFEWSFTWKEQDIIQAASEELYAEDDIEGAFYQHGGYNGIIALILFFRKSQKIQKNWASIMGGSRALLVERVAQMLSRQIVEWIPKFLEERRRLGPHQLRLGPHSLHYLGAHAGRKRKRHTSETEGSSGAIQTRPPPSTTVPQQSQEIHQIGPALAAKKDQQHRQLSNTHHQDAPTPISNVSYHNDSPSSVFLAPSDLPINPLPVLLYSLGCSQIRQDILFRGLLLQKRWDDRGKVHEITLRDAGFKEQITCLFSSQSELEQTIESCIQLGLVVQGVLEDGSQVYSTSDRSRHQISQSFQRDELHLIGLMFTTYIYPRDQTLEPSFQDLGKLLLPYLERIWEFVQGKPRPTLPAHIRNSLVEASLATYKLLGAPRKKDLISVLAKIQDPELPDYLRMAIVDRRSILLRFKGDHGQSDVVIRDFLGSIIINSNDMRSYCAYGRLLLSRTENAILRKEFDKAESYLASWQVKNLEPSGLELQVVRLKNTVLGRVSRYEGKFPDARYYLEECLKTIPGDASRYHVMHHLGDVYCELGVPGEVEKLVHDEIKQLRARGKQHSKAFRRLVLPLAEAYILQGKFEEAKALLRELLDIFEGIIRHDISDQLSHVRSMIGLARVSRYQARWSDACQTLENALGLTERYTTFSKGNYYIGVIYLFLSVVNFELHKYPEARLTLASATDILCKEIPRYFIPGLGSYFLRDLLRIERSLQWPWSSINENKLSTTLARAQML
ncbi:hypothetical protein B0J14DRAFT_114015 [Halenospora varia]|nr:hypothetical protein B0J14DRAFT_114015 [Halenospora varia]